MYGARHSTETSYYIMNINARVVYSEMSVFMDHVHNHQTLTPSNNISYWLIMGLIATLSIRYGTNERMNKQTYKKIKIKAKNNATTENNRENSSMKINICIMYIYIYMYIILLNIQASVMCYTHFVTKKCWL